MDHFHLYQYGAVITEVYDGDTCTVEFDLGFKIHFTEKVRLIGINAPEVRGDERERGLISRDRLREKILNQAVFIETEKDEKEKYGRYLGKIYLKNSDDSLLCINDWMVDEGLAVYHKY